MWRLAVIAVLVAAGFAVRLVFESDPGPVFIAPILAAGFWYGRRGGVAVGVASTLLYVARPRAERRRHERHRRRRGGLPARGLLRAWATRSAGSSRSGASCAPA